MAHDDSLPQDLAEHLSKIMEETTESSETTVLTETSSEEAGDFPRCQFDGWEFKNPPGHGNDPNLFDNFCAECGRPRSEALGEE